VSTSTRRLVGCQVRSVNEPGAETGVVIDAPGARSVNVRGCAQVVAAIHAFLAEAATGAAVSAAR